MELVGLGKAAEDGQLPPDQGVRLDRFDNAWFDPGARVAKRALWMAVSASFFQTWFPWPSSLKAALLRAFGARVGAGLNIKPRVTIKYPWRLIVGEYVWLGEGVWIDNLAMVTIGSHSCLSQAAMIETGSHAWDDPAFGLIVASVTLGEGVWLAVRSTLLPGTIVGRNAVVGAGVSVSGVVGDNVIVTEARDRTIRARTIKANRASGPGVERGRYSKGAD